MCIMLYIIIIQNDHWTIHWKNYSHLIFEIYSHKESIVELKTRFTCLHDHSHSTRLLSLRKLHLDYQSCVNVCKKSIKLISDWRIIFWDTWLSLITLLSNSIIVSDSYLIVTYWSILPIILLTLQDFWDVTIQFWSSEISFFSECRIMQNFIFCVCTWYILLKTITSSYFQAVKNFKSSFFSIYVVKMTGFDSFYG